jgi:hypothetical protein
MPKTLHISLDGRSGARVRELDFDMTRIPVSSRSSKGLTVTKWSVKEVKQPKGPNAAKPFELEPTDEEEETAPRPKPKPGSTKAPAKAPPKSSAKKPRK